MHLGRAATYGLIATAYIAEKERDGPVPGRQIAEDRGMPVEYLLKILQQLVRAQVLTGERGRHGGFVLRKPPSRTTLLEVVEALEGPLSGELTVRDEIHGADAAAERIEGVCREIALFGRSRLRQGTIAELIQPDQASE